MATSVKVTEGLDVNAYLQDFADNFVPAGRGAFSGDIFSGDEYALWSGEDTSIPVEGGQALIIDSGKAGDLAYDFATHTVGGTIDRLEFGVGVTQNGDDFSTDATLIFDNLGLESTGADGIVNQLLTDLMGGDTDVLMEILADRDLTFKGSAGNDAFVSFGGDDTLKGGEGKDKFDGGDGDDKINGGAGNDKLTGDDGNDVFVFGTGSGSDKILDFEGGKGKGDVIDFHSGQFSSFAEVLDAAKEKGDNVVIKFDDGSKLTLVDTSLDDLHKSDFLFG
ncbi:hypothetical protein IHQ68_16775 [Chelatococcus sambhunathii]|uniref:Hemolysin-type calcium-binding repeat (2 copies) n=1 Tax=Chelatococcus sambhunathii TaxID=363953 RepID=A0ABU1DJK0_9HYPH|nr:hypothetical protein [Chelatococcus sambhunathii]MDR4308274.1 hypothetical protein [Chelatococcus sambhunathii]